jgi:hypothetical protein
MQMICTWPKIWAHAHCSVAYSAVKNENWNKNIFRVYHIRIIAKKNWFTRHETDRFLNNHCQECGRAYLTIHDCLSFLHEVMIGNHDSSEQNNRKLISLHNAMARTIKMHTDLQISSCWEHISTWNMHE